MDKENLQEPHEAYGPGKSILKSNAENHTVHLPMVPLKDDSIRTNDRRRVSFAPEVTLHKIDFVPQYPSQARRRETIAFIPSQISDSSDNGSSQSSQPSLEEYNEDVGRQLLDDSSDDETNIEINEEQTMEFTGQLLVPHLPLVPQPQQSLLSQTWDEVPMELTEQFQAPQAPQAPQQSESMENFAITNVPDPLHQNVEAEPTMDLTQAASNLVVELNNPEEEQPMEFTQPLLLPQNNLWKDASPNLSPVKLAEDGDMELTQSVGRISLEQVAAANDSLTVEPEQEDLASQEPVSQEPMKLTQQESSIEVTKTDADQDVAIEKTLNEEESVSVPQKRRLPSLSPPAKRAHALSYTTTIPLADISVDSIYDDDDYEAVSLTHFMKDIGIRFYDDLDIGTSSINRISISLPKVDGTEQYSLQDYVNATNRLPLLELLYFSCQEMRKNIEDGKKLFDQFDASTLQSNPKVFKQYYYNTLDKQLGMQSEFQLIKDYCRKQAMEAWYSWRTTMIRNLLELTELKYEQVLEDGRRLKERIDSAESLYLESRNRLNRLKLILAQLSNMSDSNEGVPEKVKDLKNELVDLYSKIGRYRQKTLSFRKEAVEVQTLIDESENQLVKLKEALSESEAVLNKNKTYATSEITTLELKFQALQQLTGFKYEGSEGSKLKFVYEKTYSVTLSPSGIEFAMLLTDQFLRSDVAALAMSITKNVKFVTDLMVLRERWTALKKLDEDIYRMSLRFPTTVKNDNGKCVVSIRYYNDSTRAKGTVCVSILLEDIHHYPKKALVSSTVTSGPINQQDLLSQISSNCVPNSLLFAVAH